VLGPPGAQYPAVSAPASGAATPSAAPAPEASASTEPAEPSPGRRLLRRSDAPEGAGVSAAGPPEHGYLPDPPALAERALWRYEVRYDAGVIRANAPELECLQLPVASARRIGRFAFELWLGAELIERIRFDFPLLAAEVPRQGPRRPAREQPSFEPGAHVSVRLQVPASARATRALILDRATGQTTEVTWPPRAEPPDVLCPVAAGAPTPTSR
jgi:hypothetical protein